jgi:hypothetical protein
MEFEHWVALVFSLDDNQAWWTLHAGIFKFGIFGFQGLKTLE